MVAVGELVDRFQRHVGHLQGHQPFGLLVLDVLAAFDGEEEVFGEALLDDLFGASCFIRLRSSRSTFD